EDGIRDFHVTGVQTCALPICTAILSEAMDVLLNGIASQSLSASYLGNIKSSKEPFILGSGDQATALGYYMLVRQRMELPPSLSGQISKTFVNGNGQVLGETDAQGQIWRNATVSGLPLLAVISCLSLLFHVLLAAAIVYVTYRLIKVGQEWVDSLINALGLASTSAAQVVGVAIGATVVGFLAWSLISWARKKREG